MLQFGSLIPEIDRKTKFARTAFGRNWKLNHIQRENATTSEGKDI